jgi:hypothetical protein
VLPNAPQLAAMSRLFSSAVFRELARKGRSPLFARLLRQSRLDELCPGDSTVARAFDSAFAILRKKGHRGEYVYRAALTHRILLGSHSLKTASMLTEFRAGGCKADLVILNGSATVYEIKSERDSLSRLPRQIESYRKVFAKIFVIAGELHTQAVLDTVGEDVGVMRLSRRYQISTLREATDRSDRICPATLFESLRSAEARAILLELGVPVPELPNTLLHAALRERFCGLAPRELHLAMAKVLKRSRNLAPLAELVARLPASLQPAALAVPFRRADRGRLAEAVNTPLEIARAWA